MERSVSEVVAGAIGFLARAADILAVLCGALGAWLSVAALLSAARGQGIILEDIALLVALVLAPHVLATALHRMERTERDAMPRS